MSLRRRSFVFTKWTYPPFANECLVLRELVYELFEHLPLKYNRTLVIRTSRKKVEIFESKILTYRHFKVNLKNDFNI